jgi:hypothetical protein
MKRGVLLVLSLAVTLVATPVAAAQAAGGGLLITRVCGSNGCKSIFNGLFLVEPNASATQTTTPPPMAPFYVLLPSNFESPEQVEGSFGPTTPAFFVPAAGVVRARPDPNQFTQQEWIRVSGTKESVLRASLLGLEPFPTPRLTEVVIAGRDAGDPTQYQAVFDRFSAVPEPDPFGRGQPMAIVLRADERSPWTDGHNRIAYYPDLGLLFRDGEWVRPSADLVKRIEEPVQPGGGGIAWPRVGAIAGPVIVLGAVLTLWLLTGRRRPRKLDATTEP